MDRGEKIKATYKKMLSDRTQLEQPWRDAYAYTDPKRGQKFVAHGNNSVSNAGNAQIQKAKNLDSTATEAVQLLASSMYSGLTPKNSRWFDFTDEDENATKDVKVYLNTLAKAIHTAIHTDSNFDAIALEFYSDLATVGMCGIYGEIVDGQLYLEVWTLDSMLCASTLSKERIDTVYRLCEIGAQEAAKRFGTNNLPDDIKDELKADSDSQKMYSFIHAIKPRFTPSGKPASGKFAKNMAWESVYVYEKTGQIVFESGFPFFPIVIPRWSLIPGTDYSVGQVDKALPDIKMLNKLKELYIQSIEMRVFPPTLVVDDGVININTVQLAPRKLIPVSDTNNLKPYSNGADLVSSENVIKELKIQIKRVMLADMLSAPDKKYMTAEEVQQRTQLIRQVLGPVYSRLQSELLEPFLMLVFNLLRYADLLPEAPEGIDGMVFVPEFLSPNARAQRMEEVQAMNQYEDSMTGMMQIDPTVADNYDFDKAAKLKSGHFGVPASVMRDEFAVKKIRADRAAQRAEQQQAEIQAQAS